VFTRSVKIAGFWAYCQFFLIILELRLPNMKTKVGHQSSDGIKTNRYLMKLVIFAFFALSDLDPCIPL
jgi:hypothetical protein